MITAALLKLCELSLRAVFALLLVLLVCVAVIAALARNEDATRTVLQELVPLVVPELQFGENHGGLLSPQFSLESIRYTDQAGSQVDVTDVALDWSPSDLWSKSFRIQQLDIGSVDLLLVASETAEPSAELALPELELPIAVHIGHLNIGRIQIASRSSEEQSSKPIEIADIHLTAAADGSILNLTEIRATLIQQQLVSKASADISLQTKDLWKIDALLKGHISGLPLGENETGIATELDYQLQLGDSLKNLSIAGHVSNSNGRVELQGNILPFDSRLPTKLKLRSDSLTIDSPQLAFQSSLQLELVGDLIDGFEITGPAEFISSKPHVARYSVEKFNASISSKELVINTLELGVQLDGFAEKRLSIVAKTDLDTPYNAELQARVPDGNLFADMTASWNGDRQQWPLVSLVLDVPDMANWVPQAGGAIKLKANLNQNAQGQPRLLAKGYVEKFSLGEYRLERADLDANLSLQQSGKTSLSLIVTKAILAGQSVEAANLKLNGSTDKHRLSLSLSSSLADVETKVEGGLKFAESGAVKSWNGTVSQLLVEHLQAGRLSLKSPAIAAVSDSTFVLRDACLEHQSIDKATLCASGELKENGQLTAAISQLVLPLESVSAYVDGLKAKGVLRGRGAVSGNLNQPESVTAELSLSIGEGGVAQAASGKAKDIPIFNFSKGLAWLSYHEKNLTAEFQLDEVNGGYLKAQAQSHFSFDQLSNWQTIPLYADLDAKRLPIDWLKQGLPDVRELDGFLGAKLRVNGTLGAPVPIGELQAAGDRLTVPLVGLNLDKWVVNLKPKGEQLSATLQLIADDGGTLDAALDGPWLKNGEITGTVTGKKFPLYQTPDAQIWADPKLTLRYRANQLSVGGRVDVNKALIAPTISLKPSASKISLSEDQVMVNDLGEAVEKGSGVALNADVTIAFGNDVKIKAYGLETKLGGKLQVIESPGRLTRARGEIKLVNGQYAAFGQPLKIRRGALLFQNTLLTQPALDVTAVREFDGVTVGVNARGTIDKPELELFSSPVLSQSDQLSWLVLGRPFDRKTNNKNSDNALARATRALQLQGAEFLTGKLSQRLGIEDIALESTDDGNGSALVLGKYLSPRLYLSYGLGLFDARNQLKLKYQIGRDWSFEAASDGIDSGGDILYQRER